MTEQVDLDALEAQIEGAYDLCHVNAQDVTDLIAELRQERERADELHRMFRECRRSRATLSRAEKTIEKVRLYCENQGNPPTTRFGGKSDERRTAGAIGPRLRREAGWRAELQRDA